MTYIARRPPDAARPADTTDTTETSDTSDTSDTGDTGATPERQQDGAGLISYLEHDQLVADTERPVPRAQLSTRAAAALWALRIFVIVVGAMVIYSFFSQLG